MAERDKTVRAEEAGHEFHGNQYVSFAVRREKGDGGYVAEINGTHPRYGLNRSFRDADDKDWSNYNSRKGRGYWVEQHNVGPGLYEVKEAGSVDHRMVFKKDDGSVGWKSIDRDRAHSIAKHMSSGLSFEEARQKSKEPRVPLVSTPQETVAARSTSNMKTSTDKDIEHADALTKAADERGTKTAHAAASAAHAEVGNSLQAAAKRAKDEGDKDEEERCGKLADAHLGAAAWHDQMKDKVQAAIQKAMYASEEVVQAGDYPDHPFHGNQYVGAKEDGEHNEASAKAHEASKNAKMASEHRGASKAHMHAARLQEAEGNDAAADYHRAMAAFHQKAASKGGTMKAFGQYDASDIVRAEDATDSQVGTLSGTKVVLASNPEGINQYTKGGLAGGKAEEARKYASEAKGESVKGHTEFAKRAALKASEAAEASTNGSMLTSKADDYRHAAEAHGHAAAAHRDAGAGTDVHTKNMHEAKAKYHEEMAEHLGDLALTERRKNVGASGGRGGGTVRAEDASDAQVGTLSGTKLLDEDVQFGHMARAASREKKNPASWVGDEDVWEKAKAATEKSGKYGTEDDPEEAYWPVCVHIYRQMGGTIKSRAAGGLDVVWASEAYASKRPCIATLIAAVTEAIAGDARFGMVRQA
jgi:hypothetical protein